ncbi:ectonucleoside triphosphate diphosphohydrolase 4-like isoform X2 [Lineus longissimus]|uniref:ectonucleoside triphosphate diphosphohydrolase 4-like isoform X2 n=1 Tax=Lineus longissimus TaxID=88925 RepID=UPI002B4E409E
MPSCNIHCPSLWHFSCPSDCMCKLFKRTRATVFYGTVTAIVLVTFGVLLYLSQNFLPKENLAPPPVTKKKGQAPVHTATDLSNPYHHYGVIIDCGSSGSRVFVYFWPTHDGNPNELLHIHHVIDKDLQPVIKKATPGLSSFADNPKDAYNYIKPLLDFAVQHIPNSKYTETPLYVMATAGMRLIPQAAQTAIMDNIRLNIRLNYQFLFSDNHVEVITGKQEGVYAWIATNYVLGRFHHEEDGTPLISVDVPGKEKPHVRKRTVGIIDMGGGSAQIAFEVPKSAGVNKNLMAEFNLGCKNSDAEHTYRVYVTTFLGFGANEARNRYEQMFVNETISTKATRMNGSSTKQPINDPCLPKEMNDVVKHDGKDYFLHGVGDFRSCQHKIQPLLNKSHTCDFPPCSMNGVHQPKIDYANSEFYGFSEYFYCMDDVLRMPGKYDYIKFVKASKDYCATRWPVLEEWYKKKLFPKASMHRFNFMEHLRKYHANRIADLSTIYMFKRYQCFKSAWIIEVLHEGFKFPRLYKNFQSAHLINGQDVQWTLGALLFRTRYFPLREVQEQEFKKYKPPWKHRGLGLFMNQYILLMCFVLVVAAIMIYLRRLRVYPKRGMSRVPSVAFLLPMPEEETHSHNEETFSEKSELERVFTR